MRLTLIEMCLAAALPGACVQVSSDKILVRDLLAAAPALQGVDSETPVGFTPLPGTQRVIFGRELTLIARRHGLTLTDAPDVCVERELRSISADEMQAALTAALGIPDAQLELVEFSTQPLPLGRLDFQRSALNQPPPGAQATPVIWRGKLIYDGRHSAVVWAKVRIEADRPVYVASEDISTGALINDGQIKKINVKQFPSAGPSLDAAGDIIGKIARRRIPAGQRLVAGMLEEAKDIARGDIIQVRVIDGLATLSFEGIAESSGKKGETILVHNSASGRNFRAVVEEKGKALVRPTSDD
jgi:flagella basal body P-ring formation protein FlgA